MATKKFLREPKEYTTEPSADEVGDGMKRGGHAHKKHMAMGGNPMAAPMGRAMRGRVAPTGIPAILRKRGGKMESTKEERHEEHEIKSLQKELKRHEHEKAGKAHHGLKRGGRAAMAKDNTPGGLLGGISATRPDRKKTTGDIELAGYKHGGKAHHVSGHPEGSHEHHKHMAKHHLAKHKEGGSAHHKKMHEHHKEHAKHLKDGGAAIDAFETKTTLKPKINVKDKVVGAKQVKGFHTKSGSLEGAGYKRGGHAHKYAKGGTVSDNVAKRFVSDMNDGQKMPAKKLGTKGIKQEPAGYKKGGHVKHHAHGGHVEHHTTHGHGDHGFTHMHEHVAKHHHGHEKIEAHPMKKGGHAKHHKTGSKCNY